MRIAISNIAWDVVDDERVAALLRENDIDAIDIAPGKYFPDPKATSHEDIARVRKWWSDRGIAMTGMQALLFGTQGLNLFASASVRDAMLEHFAALCRIGQGLGATRLVFGSPRNRDRSGLDDATTTRIATQFFRRLGDTAGAHGVSICLEPNPPCYNSNFMMNNEDTAAIIVAVDHPAIRMQLDTGAMTINGEDPQDILSRFHHLIGHIHASEPDLVTLGDGGCNHALIAELLEARLPEQIVSIEMLQTKSGSNLQAIERALALAIRHYRRNDERGFGA